MASSSEKPIVAAVTGASGYIAGELIHQLCTRGWTVHGTVRDLKNKEKVQHLEELAKGTPGTVKLFEADLLAPGSFRECFQGARYVFHTASPFQIGIEDPQRTLVDPALKGTENAVGEALATDTVERVVVTSSVAAVRNTTKPCGSTFDEKDWNTTSTLETEPYPLSKYLAERRAWELVEQHRAAGGKKTLCTINPSFVLGAPRSAHPNSTSVKTVRALLDGTAKAAGGCLGRQFCTVNVNNVAAAHVEAAVRPEASGRYILSCRDPEPHLRYCEILRKLYPTHPIPDQQHPRQKLNPPSYMDGSKAERELGIHYIPIETSLQAMAEQLMDLGVVPRSF